MGRNGSGEADDGQRGGNQGDQIDVELKGVQRLEA
jgi:hypothetical protein